MRFVHTERLDSGGTYRLWTDGPPRAVTVGDAEIFEAFTFSAESFVRPGIRLEMAVRVIGGVPQCVSVSFHSTHPEEPVIDAVVRDFRLEHWIEVACSRAVHTPPAAYEAMEWNDSEPSFPPGVPSVIEAAGRARKAARQARRSRRGHSDDLLRRVADTYEANSSGTPTKAVGEAFGVAQSTAQLYVKKARERGFITSPAPKGGRP